MQSVLGIITAGQGPDTAQCEPERLFAETLVSTAYQTFIGGTSQVQISALGCAAAARLVEGLR